MRSTEINDFLIENFPSEWDRVSWDLLNEAGYGLTKERTDQARQHIDDEVAFEFDCRKQPNNNGNNPQPTFIFNTRL